MDTEEKIDGLADGSWKIQLENVERVNICKRLRHAERELAYQTNISASMASMLGEIARLCDADENEIALNAFKSMLQERDQLRQRIEAAGDQRTQLRILTRKAVDDITAERDQALARLEAADKQEPAIMIQGNGKVLYNPNYEGSIYGEFYALPPIPAAEPKQPEWKKEAKRAFWSGYEISATFGGQILPRWNEYIAKRIGELAADGKE